MGFTEFTEDLSLFLGLYDSSCPFLSHDKDASSLLRVYKHRFVFQRIKARDPNFFRLLDCNLLGWKSWLDLGRWRDEIDAVLLGQAWDSVRDLGNWAVLLLLPLHLSNLLLSVAVILLGIKAVIGDESDRLVELVVVR